MSRVAYAYRLIVSLPEGCDADDWLPPCLLDEEGSYVGRNGWEVDGVDEDGVFHWPRFDRAYLSERAANKRASLLRKYGATVEVLRSEPIRWERTDG
ncbi:MAG: hypothetical protein KGL35_06460 [Bradyrhizobium sp.]|nr:hypothetical protein [Bradyrhizobium sp.]